MKRWVISFGLVIFLIFLSLFLKVYLSSRMEYYQAQNAFQQREYHKAISHYTRSILWYTPFSKYVSISVAKLWQIGNLAETQNNIDLALEAYESLRSSLYGVRSFYTPYQEWINKCNQKISSLVAAKGPTVQRDKDKSYAQRKTKYLHLLEKDAAPDIVWSLILETGLIGWVGATIGFIFLAFSREGALHNRKALFWGSLIIIFYLLWIIGMLKA
jgi:hypothetical protein